MSAAKRGSVEDAGLVYEAWRRRQRRPELCRYTEERRELIRKRLGLGYTAGDLIALFRWVWEADDQRCAWLRGENPKTDGRSYLDLDSLLRAEKLGARVQAALEWADGGPRNAPTTTHDGTTHDGPTSTAAYGAYAHLRSRGVRR